MLSEPLQELPRLLVGPTHGAQRPDLGRVRLGPLADALEVGEQKSRGLHLVVAQLQHHDECQPCLDERCELRSLVQHAAVGGDQAVPGPLVVMQREQQLPVIE